MMAVVRNIGCTAIQVGGVEDHIHICYGLGRTITMAQVAEKVKTSTTKWLKGKWPGCRDFAWLAGYATYGVGTHGVDDVVAYIQGQEEHHRHESFEEEYKRILDEAGIEYDPRYMFE
jgi:hypothetical protein